MVVPGVVGAGYTAVSAVTVDRADALEARVGRERAIAGTYGACALAMLAPLAALYGPVPLVAAVALGAVAFQALSSVAAVVRNAYLHEHAESLTRATTMSAVAFAFSVVHLPVVLAGGVLADAFGPTTAVVATGAFALCGDGLVVAVDGSLTSVADHAVETDEDRSESASTTS